MYERLEMHVPIELWAPVAFEASIFFLSRGISIKSIVFYYKLCVSFYGVLNAITIIITNVKQ